MSRHQKLMLVLIGIVGLTLLASHLRAGGDRGRSVRPEDVIVTGKLVDLQSFMTDKHAGADAARASQDSIRAGVPAALETEDGLIVVGMGERGPARLLVPLALQQVELKGKLYEKDGLQYLDITSARAIKEESEHEHEHEDGAEEEPGDEAPEEEEEP